MKSNAATDIKVTAKNLWEDESSVMTEEEKKAELVKEVSQLMVDYDLIDVDSIEAQAKEMQDWPEQSLIDLKNQILEKKVEARKIVEIARNTVPKKKKDSEIEWKSEDFATDFGRNFIKFSCGDDVLEAALANDSIDKLEEMAAEAHRELLKAKRKALVLDKAVQKAHELLELRALEFMDSMRTES